MGPATVVIVAAIAAKVVSFGWLASIATSPVDVATRRRFLDHTDEMIDNPSLKELGYSDEDLTAVRKDLADLRASVNDGWHDKRFDAAVRVAAFKTYARMYGSFVGSIKLINHQFDRLIAGAFDLKDDR
jgi:hypothetical protein